MFQALRLGVLESMKDDEVWEKRATNIYAQMKPAEKVKEAVCTSVFVCVRAQSTCICEWESMCVWCGCPAACLMWSVINCCDISPL